MPSALGIRRIKDVDVSQVLHATETDIRTLQSRLKTWGVSSFRSYPVLLRALTHPSISNWAERVLNLPKRSLGPNTLELLGDRVVGTATAFRVLQWRKAKKLDHLWHRGRPDALAKSLVGNRGMAVVAADIGIDNLIRWEKGRPPESHRGRLDPSGVDQATGILSNVQINALSSAYEAIAAAVYLDGGFHPAESFVHNTLLQDPRSLQTANVDVLEYEGILAREIENVIGSSVSFVVSRHRPGRSASVPIKSFEKVQCEMLDLESTTPQNEAHRVYYAGIALRPMVEVENDINEEDLFYVGSHLSVENARIAALTGAIEVLRGQRDARMISQDANITPEVLRMREIIFGQGSPVIETKFRRDGMWWLDGDYRNAARVLHRVGAPGMASLQDIHNADVREGLQRMYMQRNPSVQEEDTRCQERQQRMYMNGDQLEGGFPRQKREVGEAAIEVQAIEKCLEAGVQIESSRLLTKEHDGLQQTVSTAQDVCKAITATMDDVRGYGMQERSLLMKSYHVLGHNTMKLWGVQRSMSDVCQDRIDVIGECAGRGKLGRKAADEMIGDGLRDIGDLRLKKAFVALGICIEQVGLSTCIAWLSGAEERVKGLREIEAFD